MREKHFSSEETTRVIQPGKPACRADAPFLCLSSSIPTVLFMNKARFGTFPSLSASGYEWVANW